MKTRDGFVSNSSSSSFILFGMLTDKDSLAEAFGVELGVDDDMSDCEGYKKLERKFTVIEDYECGDVYIGFGDSISSDDGMVPDVSKIWAKMRVDETKLEFEQRIRHEIDEAAGAKLGGKMGFFSGAYPC